MSNQYHRPDSQALPPGVEMLRMITSYQVSQAISVAARLGIADLLKDGPKNSVELAQATGTHAPSLYRMLRALAAHGVFGEDVHGSFSLTPLGATLQTGVPGSVRGMAMMTAIDWQPWGALEYSVRTGQPACQHVYGMPLFEYLDQHPDDAAIFNEAMTSITGQFAGAVANTYDFSGIKTLVDVGGGHGVMLAMILKRYPNMRGTLFDLPSVIDEAPALLESYGVANRCEVVGGDFFESVPEGADAYIMKSVIHDWDDERAVQILKTIHRAMPDNGRLLLVEQVIPPGSVPSFGKQIDLEMLVMTHSGRERTEVELRELMAAAGFVLAGLTPTPAPVWVVEGHRA